MNILYIIGNGFDLAQGLKTKYEHFYPYYLKCDSPNNVVKRLKEEIKDNIGDWSDMELALGKFTRKVNSEKELTDMYFDLSDRLAEYLKHELEQKNCIENKKVTDDFMNPSRYLEELDQRLYGSHLDFYFSNSKTVSINIITLNYTSTIEQLIGYPNGQSLRNGYYHIDSVCHLHGKLDDTILIGVNDEGQIANESYKDNQAVKELLIKPVANYAMRSDNDLVCKNFIRKADIILLYGVSLGETDAYLWKEIVQQLSRKNAPLLVYFHYSTEIISKNRRQLLGRSEAKARERLYSRMGIPETLQSTNKILIGYNKDIFKSPQP